MSFHLNNAQQMAINDSLLSLTEGEMKYLNPTLPKFLQIYPKYHIQEAQTLIG